jgi:hypothetical protein
MGGRMHAAQQILLADANPGLQGSDGRDMLIGAGVRGAHNSDLCIRKLKALCTTVFEQWQHL